MLVALAAQGGGPDLSGLKGWAGVIAIVAVALFGKQGVGFIRGLGADRRRERAQAASLAQTADVHELSVEELSDALIEQRLKAYTTTMDDNVRRLREDQARLYARVAQLEQTMRAAGVTVPAWPDVPAAPAAG